MPEATQPGSGNVVSAGVGAQREARPALGLGAEPNPAESRPKGNFPFLDCRNPNVVLPGLGDGGSGPPPGTRSTRCRWCVRSYPQQDGPRRCRSQTQLSPEPLLVLRGSPGRGKSAKRALEMSFRTGRGICSEQTPAKLHNLPWRLNKSYYSLVVTVYYKGYFQTLGQRPGRKYMPCGCLASARSLSEDVWLRCNEYSSHQVPREKDKYYCYG